MKPVKRICQPDFNRSIIIEADTHNHTSSDAGAVLIRSIIDKTEIMDFLISGLHDRRDQNRIMPTLARLLLQCILMLS